ncbi:MAG TPA: cytochrome c oxidase subunit 3 family protein [Terriglobales bacterium]|nr:cytochrome c oxidase subunit 3 family protein [Terriglobales bacterium]
MADTPLMTEHEEGLQHQFVDMEQQRNAASLGMWLFLATEIMFFGGMFLAYLVYRYWYYPEFAAGSRSIDIVLGTVNTAVLICSSLTVALGVKAAQLGKRKTLVTLLLITILLGLAFLAIKGIEWYDKFEEHHVPGRSFSAQDLIEKYPQIHIDPAPTQIYFSLYFAMTGLHALHMIIGVGIFAFLTYHAWKGRYTPEYHTPIEIGGLYWHFVDIVWIYLFPLLYLIDRKPLK